MEEASVGVMQPLGERGPIVRDGGPPTATLLAILINRSGGHFFGNLLRARNILEGRARIVFTVFIVSSAYMEARNTLPSWTEYVGECPLMSSCVLWL